VGTEWYLSVEVLVSVEFQTIGSGATLREAHIVLCTTALTALVYSSMGMPGGDDGFCLALLRKSYEIPTLAVTENGPRMNPRRAFLTSHGMIDPSPGASELIVRIQS
jgi:hypothetical protein